MMPSCYNKLCKLLGNLLLLLLLITFDSVQVLANSVVESKELPPRLREQVKELQSRDPAIRINAARALGKMGEEAIPAIPYLVDLIFSTENISSSLESEQVALRSLVLIGQPGLDALRHTVKAAKPVLLRKLSLLLARENHKETMEAILSQLQEIKGDLRTTTVLAMSGKVRPDIDLLLSGLESKDAEVREMILFALLVSLEREQMQSEDFQEGVLNKIISVFKNDTDHFVRAAAAELLGESHNKTVLTELIEGFKRREAELVVNKIAVAIGELGNVAVEPLLLAMSDADVYVRRGAALSLAQGLTWGKLTDPRVMEVLVTGVEDPDTEISEYCHNGLKSFSGKNYRKDSRKWREWWKQEQLMNLTPMTPLKRQ